MAICFDESWFIKSVSHKDSNQKGFGGVDVSIWGDKLQKQNIDPKSLKAIEFVWLECLEFTKNDPNKALKLYKGTSKNKKSYNRTKRYYDVCKRYF